MKRISNIRILDLVLSLSIVVFFFWIFFKYTLNVPVNDDYGVLESFNKIIEADSFFQKIKLFFAQHNEHRIVYDRFWFLMSYAFNGQVNFNFLSFVGNLSLLGMFVVFAKRASDFNSKYLVFFPIAILLFNLTFYENVTFPMAALSNFTVVLFSLASLYFLSVKELTNKRFTLALVFCLCAILTQGGGVFVIPVSLLLLYLKKDYKRLKYYGGIGALLLIFYFIGYTQPENSPSLLSTLVGYKVRSFVYTLAFLGNCFSFSFYHSFNYGEANAFQHIVNDTLMLNAAVGLGLIIFYLYQFQKKYYQKNPFNFAVMTLIIIIAVVTGLTRSQLGIETAFASRYRILSAIFLIAVFIRMVEYAQSRNISALKINSAIVVLSALYFYNFSYSQEEYYYDRKNQVLKGVMLYHSGNHKLLYGFEQDLYKTILEKSEKLGTYSLLKKEELEKDIPFSRAKIMDFHGLDGNGMNQNVEEITKIFDSYYIKGFAYINDENTDKQRVFIVTSNQKGTYFYNTHPMHRYDLNSFFNMPNLENGGFFVRIKADDFPPGETKISVYVENYSLRKLIMTDKIITK